MLMNPGAGIGRGLSASAVEDIGADTQEVEGLQVGNHDVRVFNPKIIADLVEQDVKLSDLPTRLKDKIPAGYRLPTTAEIAELKTEKQEKFTKLTAAAQVPGDRFNFLTDDGEGVTRSSEWSADGASFEEQNKGADSERKRELKLQAGDLAFLVKAEAAPKGNS